MSSNSDAHIVPIVSKSMKLKSSIRRFGKAVFSPIGIVLVGAVCYTDYRRRKSEKFTIMDSDKKVLILPFHKMKIVETKSPSPVSILSLIRASEEKQIEIEVKELVDIIHEAAQDPNVCALYGIFGHGFRFSANGAGHVEEVRNALRVFRESHRVHKEPNLSYEEVLSKNGHGAPKPTYAYADTFWNYEDANNQEYYLASAFSHIHLQAQGEVALFGAATTQFFLREFLDNNGVKVDVFKRGKFKNAPNSFTEKDFTREHKENVTNIMQSLDEMTCCNIEESRSLKGFNKAMWKKIRSQGSFTAKQAHALGLIDFMPKLNPLFDLIDSNNDDESKAAMKQKWGKETDMDKFSAKKSISLGAYSNLLAQRKRSSVFVSELSQDVQDMKGEAFKFAKNVFGLTSDEKQKTDKRERIAILHVDGQIDDNNADKTINALRKIKKDDNIKCVVMRVDSPGGSVTASERILQECNDIPQPVICSMSNVCASGGYYIATGCKRIFALPNTITGSIGVYGMRFDLSNLAKMHGVKVQHVAIGPHSTTFSVFQPLTKPLERNFSRHIDECYDYFKFIVSESRGLSMEEVENLAQGRVWTGEQAKSFGLVDDLSGLTGAVAYAKRTYTSGVADVEVWPKRMSIRDVMLSEDWPLTLAAYVRQLRRDESRLRDITTIEASKLLISSVLESPSSHSAIAGVMMTVDVNTALNCLMRDYTYRQEAQRDKGLSQLWR